MNIKPETNKAGERICMSCEQPSKSGTTTFRWGNSEKDRNERHEFFFCYPCRDELGGFTNSDHKTLKLDKKIEELMTARQTLEGNYELNLSEMDVLIIDRALQHVAIATSNMIVSSGLGSTHVVTEEELIEVKRKIGIFASVLKSSHYKKAVSEAII